MNIGFIGYGNMAESLATKWRHKHAVCFGGRNSQKAKALAERIGHGARYGKEAVAVKFGDIVVLATPHEAVFDAINAAGGPQAFAGKIVIDINNPVADVTNDDYTTKTYPAGSLSEAIAARIPEARVVKAFNMCHADVWKRDSPRFDGRNLVVLYCGDDDSAKRTIASLIGDMPFDSLDLGGLRYARLLEPAACIVIKLLYSGHDTLTVLNLLQPEKKPVAWQGATADADKPRR